MEYLQDKLATDSEEAVEINNSNIDVTKLTNFINQKIAASRERRKSMRDLYKYKKNAWKSLEKRDDKKEKLVKREMDILYK